MLEFPNMILNHTREYIILSSWKFALLRCFFPNNSGQGGGSPPTQLIEEAKFSHTSTPRYPRGATKILEGREKTGGRGGYIRVITKNFEWKASRPPSQVDASWSGIARGWCLEGRPAASVPSFHPYGRKSKHFGTAKHDELTGAQPLPKC